MSSEYRYCEECNNTVEWKTEPEDIANMLAGAFHVEVCANWYSHIDPDVLYGMLAPEWQEYMINRMDAFMPPVPGQPEEAKRET